MQGKNENPKGLLKINDVEYTFSFEGKYLFLFHKEANDHNALKIWDHVREMFSSQGKWITARGEFENKIYYFHCSSPFYHTRQKFSLMVDYYANLVSNTEIDDFGNSLADGFLFTADFIGEYIKDCIIAQHSANDGSLRLDFPQKCVKLIDQDIEFTFCHEVVGNPAYYGLSAIKPVLKVATPSVTVDKLIEVFGNISQTFAFTFRKNIVTVSTITILRKAADGKLVASFQIYFTNFESNDIQYNRIISSRALPYFGTIYQLVAAGELNTYHIPKNCIFEVTHLILMYSWFEKLYKTLPRNSLVELKINKKGKKQLFWKAGHPDSKKRGNLVSDKDQFALVLHDNPSLKDYALALLMKFSGFLYIDEFINEFPARVSRYRNDIIHNEDISWYRFISQDTSFLELINYYLIMKYKCQCTDSDLEQLIRGWFLDL